MEKDGTLFEFGLAHLAYMPKPREVQKLTNLRLKLEVYSQNFTEFWN